MISSPKAALAGMFPDPTIYVHRRQSGLIPKRPSRDAIYFKPLGLTSPTRRDDIWCAALPNLVYGAGLIRRISFMTRPVDGDTRPEAWPYTMLWEHVHQRSQDDRPQWRYHFKPQINAGRVLPTPSEGLALQGWLYRRLRHPMDWRPARRVLLVLSVSARKSLSRLMRRKEVVSTLMEPGGDAVLEISTTWVTTMRSPFWRGDPSTAIDLDTRALGHECRLVRPTGRLEMPTPRQMLEDCVPWTSVRGYMTVRQQLMIMSAAFGKELMQSAFLQGPLHGELPAWMRRV